MIRAKLLRRIISSESYYPNRMSEMDRKCAYYLDQGAKASNQKLRRALFETAAMYHGRYMFYFNKISKNELRESVQN